MPTIKNIATFLVASILLTSLCFSCNFMQKEVAKKNILNVDYYVRYLQADKQLKVNISFTKIDSTEKITPEKMEEVLFADQVLSGKKVGNQYRYELTKEVPFVESYKLSYRLNHNEMDSMTIQLHAMNDFSIKKGKVSKSAGTDLTFEGVEQATNETLVLLFSDRNNQTAMIKIGNHTVNAPIVILPEQIGHLAVGEGKVYLVKKQTIQTKSADTELTGKTEYYSAVKSIEIIE